MFWPMGEVGDVLNRSENALLSICAMSYTRMPPLPLAV